MLAEIQNGYPTGKIMPEKNMFGSRKNTDCYFFKNAILKMVNTKTKMTKLILIVHCFEYGKYV